jgi:hypothetical protein
MHMRKKTTLILFVLTIPLLLAACGTYRHDRYGYPGNGYDQYGYGARDAFQYGYQRGFELGTADRKAGESFDYDDGDLYKHGISDDHYINEQFRSGFKRGYTDGYYGRGNYR